MRPTPGPPPRSASATARHTSTTRRPRRPARQAGGDGGVGVPARPGWARRVAGAAASRRRRDASVLAFLRTGEAGDPPVLVVANFTPVPRDGYRLGVPIGGFWKEILNSDATLYGGSGIGNRGGMDAEAVPWRGFEQSLVVTAP